MSDEEKQRDFESVWAKDLSASSLDLPSSVDLSFDNASGYTSSVNGSAQPPTTELENKEDYADNGYDAGTEGGSTLGSDLSTFDGEASKTYKNAHIFESDEINGIEDGTRSNAHFMYGQDIINTQITLDETVSSSGRCMNGMIFPLSFFPLNNLSARGSIHSSKNDSVGAALFTDSEGTTISSTRKYSRSNIVEHNFFSLMAGFSNMPKILQVTIGLSLSVFFGCVVFICIYSLVPVITRREAQIIQGRGASLSVTEKPTVSPSGSPSWSLSDIPTSLHSSLPSIAPTFLSSHSPSSIPTTMPSSQPSLIPSKPPSTSPTASPSHEPTKHPTATPTLNPTISMSPTYTPIVFYVLGNIPRNSKETNALQTQITQIPDDAHFVVFTGNMQNPDLTNCNASSYSLIGDIMKLSHVPVFMLPGEKDWKECPDQKLSWSTWTSNFVSFENNWSHSFEVRRSPKRIENFSFYFMNVLFVGVNIPGGSVYNQTEWDLQLSDNLEWTHNQIESVRDDMVGMVLFCHGRAKKETKDFFRPFARKVKRLHVPSLYIHGGQRYVKEKQAIGTNNLLGVQTDNGGDAPPLRVKFLRDGDKPFEFDRRIS